VKKSKLEVGMKFCLPKIAALAFLILIASCNRDFAKQDEKSIKNEQITVVSFPFTFIELIDTSEERQIALHLTRKPQNDTVDYRVEHLINWRSMKMEYGKVLLGKMKGDSTFVFKGGSDECDITIEVTLHTPLYQTTARIERRCKDQIRNISFDEFELLSKGISTSAP
jgi:hypothetical protein